MSIIFSVNLPDLIFEYLLLLKNKSHLKCIVNILKNTFPKMTDNIGTRNFMKKIIEFNQIYLSTGNPYFVEENALQMIY